MAPDKKLKRKAPAAAVAPAADSPAKKTKKASETPQEKSAPKPAVKKTKDTEDKSAVKAKKANDEKPTRQVKPRKRAADFLTDDESAAEEAAPVKAKANAKVEAESKKSSNKKSKKEDGSAAPAPKAATKTASAKASPKASKKVEAAEESDSDEDDVSAAPDAAESDNEDEEDDQTAALIRGFESSGDEDESGDEGFDPSKPVPKIPDSKKTKRKLLKKQKEEKSGNSEEPGTVYIGRIPHGFYEHQMRAYFSQFGEITRLRLSRNRLTGRSKHYAFVEFNSTSVAKIVAGTMDNYLMYGHILKCKYVPAEQLHPEIWKGANRRFKHTPWNRIEKKRLDKGKTREQWTERIEREQKRRLAKAEKLKAMGYEFDMPELMSVDQVPIQEEKEETKAVEAAEEPAKAVEEAPAAEKETKETKADDTPKKSKKEKKQPASEQGTPKQSTPKQSTPKQGKAEPKGDVTPSSASKAAKKGGKKSKAKA